MTTVTAKELRKNLSAYLDRMEAGEEIAVIRHSRIVGSLKPQQDVKKNNGPEVAKAMRKFLEENKHHEHRLDTSKSYKELYHEHLVEKYGKYTGK
ncbi:MAG TPA: hypothetical protein VFI78_01890 [Salinimicrobium sp.]|nr:hypothetical protein [Salinimicrobium sp.]